LSLLQADQHAVRSQPSIHSLARPPTATKWASLPSSPALLPQSGRREQVRAQNLIAVRYVPSCPVNAKDASLFASTLKCAHLIPNPFKDVHALSPEQRKARKDLVTCRTAEGQGEPNQPDLV